MECQNLICPLKEDCDNIDLLHFRYDNIDFIRCMKCQVAYYCCQRCLQQDWFSNHQFECRGANQELLQSEVKRIEQSTPFIKDGFLLRDRDSVNIEMGNITLSNVEFIKTGNYILGKGSYGEVELAKNKQNGKKIAVKKIDKQMIVNKKLKTTLLREVEIHKKLKHDNIIRLYTSLEDNKYIYLILEYAQKGNLFYLIRNKKSLNEVEAFYFFIQACVGIYFLHKNGFIHRDIKPENLLIDEDNILKICDFGWCVQANDREERNTFCGTFEYMAPEMIQNLPHNHTLDIWSLGILLYELVHGYAPFRGHGQKEIEQKILRRNIIYNQKCSKEYKDLVEKLLQIEPQNRLPLIKVFDHPWVKNFEKEINLSKNNKQQQESQKEDEQFNLFKNQLKQVDQQQKIEQKQLSDSSVCSENLESKQQIIIDSDEDVMKEIEDLVSTKKKCQKNKQNDVYDMCDQILQDLDSIDAELEQNCSSLSINKVSLDNIKFNTDVQSNKYQDPISKKNKKEGKLRRSTQNIFQRSSKPQQIKEQPKSQMNVQNNADLIRQNYQEPVIEMRPTDQEQVNYDKLRSDYLKNFETFCQNLESNIVKKNENLIKKEVKDYVKIAKDYNKQYKENIEKKKSDSLSELQQDNQVKKQNIEQRLLCSNEKKVESRSNSIDKINEQDLWQCQRVRNKQEHLKSIPLGEKEILQWKKTRKIDTHLDLDFLPRNIAYDYGDNFAQSNKMIEKVLSQMQYEEGNDNWSKNDQSDEEEQEYKSKRDIKTRQRQFNSSFNVRGDDSMRYSNVTSNYSRNIFATNKNANSSKHIKESESESDWSSEEERQDQINKSNGWYDYQFKKDIEKQRQEKLKQKKRNMRAYQDGLSSKGGFWRSIGEIFPFGCVNIGNK